MTSHFAVIGKTGQLARALKHQIEESGDRASFYDRQDLDLTTTPDVIQRFIQNIPKVDAVILAAAYTAVDQAENDRDAAMAANARAPGLIAAECQKRNIPLIHFSTDYVFNGEAHSPYKVSDKTDPINVYGYSKRVGELSIQASGCQHAILRTSWVFDGTGKNFLTTMLRLSKTHPSLNIVADQLGRPTYAGHLAQAGLSAAKGLLEGKDGSSDIFHISNTGPIISWAEFAKAIFKAQNITISINSIPTSEYPTPAKRPAYSALDTRKFETIFDYTLPNWQDGLSAALAERAKGN